MSVALRLFDVVFTEKYTIQEKLIYLESCDNLATFIGEDERNVDNVRKKIKELLSSTDQRAEGLALLHTVLSQCSSRIFSLEAVAWVQLCIKTIENNELPEIKKLSSSVLCQLIHYVSSYSDLSKKVSTTYITPLVESLLKITIEDEWKVEALQLLVCCMTYFPGPCGNSKIEIEKLVLKYLYSWNEKSLEVVSQCVAQLPLIGGQGNLGLSHTNSWFDQFSSILSSLDQLLEFFDDQANLDDMETLVLASLEIPKLPSDPLMSIFYASKLYQFLGLCLQKMISTNVDVPVRVPVSSILDHVCHSLALKSTVQEQINLDKIASSSVLPSLHIVSLQILETLILCCGDVLIPHSTLINNLLLQTLEKSTDQEDSESEPTYYYSNLRKVVYQVLQTFVKKLGFNCQVHESLSSFYPHIHLDIKTKEDEVKLLNKSKQIDDNSHPRSKKKRKISIDLDPISKEESHKIKNPDCDAETVKESLAALKVILYNCGPHIKEDIYRNVQKTIITILLKVQQNPNQIPVPYNNPHCRRELYQVLLAAVLCPSISCPPPYQPAIRLFSYGQRDFVGPISEFCGEASIICSSIAHPIVAPLQFIPPIQIQGSYMSEASDTASNESEYNHEERDSIMEEEDEDEEYGEEYSTVHSGLNSVEEIMKRQAQPKLMVPLKPSMPTPQKSHPTPPATMERHLQPSTRNEIVLVDEEIESKTINMRNRLVTPTRAVVEERKPSPASVQQQLLRKNEEVKKAQPIGIAPLVDIPRNSQPRPKSVQNALNAKIQDREVLDVSEEVDEVEGISDDEGEDLEEDEDDEGEEDGHYDEEAEDSDDYYDREEINDREETVEDRDEFMKNVYGETSIVFYKEERMSESQPKADISKKSQIPLIQKNTPNSNSTTVTITNPNQRTIKTSSGVIRLEECNSSEIFQTPNVPFQKTETSFQANKKNGASALKNELTPKPIVTPNEQNHIAAVETSGQTSSKDLDFQIVDISSSPMKPPVAILQNENDTGPMVISVTSTTFVEHHSEVEEMETEPCNENNITIAAQSPEPNESVNQVQEILNQKSPSIHEDEDYRQEYQDPYEVEEECVQAPEEDGKQLEELDESEAKKSCIAVEEKPFEAMVKDFVPCAKDD